MTRISDYSFRLAGSSERGTLLIHGLAGAPGEMKFLANKLNAQGFTIYAPQLAGHGIDPAALLRTTWRDWYDSVKRAHDEFKREVRRVYVAGICAGAALALKLAAERHEIAGVAAYSMTFDYDGWNMKSWYGATWLITRLANLPGIRRILIREPRPFGLKDERLREAIANFPQLFAKGAFDRVPLGSLCQMARLAQHVERIGPSITAPTLIVHAREDDMSHPRNSERLKACLGGPAELRFVEDSYHMVHVDRERHLVADMTARFFLGLSSAAPAVREEIVIA